MMLTKIPIIATIVMSSLISPNRADFELNILHTNDVHSRIEEVNEYGGRCSARDKTEKRCVGGVARIQTIVESLRATEKNVILLDAGDQFQGTLWFEIYNGTAAVTFMNMSKYDVMTLGNHEFDNGPSGVVNLIENAAFPVISSNIDVSKDKTFSSSKAKLAKSTIVEREGKKIGVIGYITQDTARLSKPGSDITFSDVITSVRTEAQRLKNEGVQILIALGHAGYLTDKKVAEEIEELDIVVGGHTNTFLYNGPSPSVEVAEGPYPVVETHSDSTRALVVQAFTYGKYMGHLKVLFDDQGNVKTFSGNPILLNASHGEDAKAMKLVNDMDGLVIEEKKKRRYLVEIGKTNVLLEGGKPDCRVMDCSLGNLVTDAVVRMNQKTPPPAGKWSNVAMALWSSGGLRSSISRTSDDPITYEDLLQAMPFKNTADIATMSGKLLREVLEHAVSGVEHLSERFLQMSGIHIKYDRNEPVGNRLKIVTVLCLECKHPKYEPLENNKYYQVVADSYILGGGADFSMLKEIDRVKGELDVNLVKRYIEQETPITITSEERIQQVSSRTVTTSIPTTNTACKDCNLIPYTVFIASMVTAVKVVSSFM